MLVTDKHFVCILWRKWADNSVAEVFAYRVDEPRKIPDSSSIPLWHRVQTVLVRVTAADSVHTNQPKS